MQLTFQNTLTFTDGQKTCLSHEPDNTLTEFFLTNNKISNKSATPVYGQYNNLTFAEEARRMPPALVKDFGVKTFPHFGSYGFYTPKYFGSSKLVIPINKPVVKTTAPSAVITDTGTAIHVVITGEYECFRIIVRKDQFATEFITYSHEYDFVPMYTGTCTITIIGHSNEIQDTSYPFECTMQLTDRT